MGRLTLLLKSYFIKLWKFIKIGCVEVFYIQFSKLERKKNNQNVQEKFLSSMLIPDMPCAPLYQSGFCALNALLVYSYNLLK